MNAIPSLSVKVEGYEEQIEDSSDQSASLSPSSTKTFTVYRVKVEATTDQKTKAVYFLRKRFTEFQNLYKNIEENNSLMRDVLAKHSYKFPNISMFSTRTQATKDRRRAGFDELLKLLTIPGQYVCKEVSVFLEFEHHLGDLAIAYTGAIVTPNKQKAVNASTTPLSPSSPIRNNTTNNNNNNNGNSVNAGATSTAAGAIDNKSGGSKETIATPSNDDDTANDADANQADNSVNDIILTKILTLIPSSVIIVFVFYGFLVSTKIIDVTQTSQKKLLLTMISLTFFILLLRLSLLKQELIKKNN
jgi:hypothetical protein